MPLADYLKNRVNSIHETISKKQHRLSKIQKVLENC